MRIWASETPKTTRQRDAATNNFLAFCRASSRAHAFPNTLKASLKIWDEKVSPLQKSQELGRLKLDLFLAQRESKKLLQQAGASRDAEAKAEYVEDKASRRGMRPPLSQTQRATVWEIRDMIVAAMEDTGAFSKNYSRIKTIEALSHFTLTGDPDPGALTDPRPIDIAFVDESQELTSADLKALKMTCKSAVVMAGDAGFHRV